MSKYERLGSFILLEKIEEDKFSKNFLAGHIVNNQIERVNLLKKFDHSLSTLPDLILDLNQEYEILKNLVNPSISRPNVFVQDKSEFAAVFDYVEGKSLRAMLNKCVQEGFPFTVDHSLLICSRLCSALEYLHSKKVSEQRLVHGCVCPENIFVSYDGEIKLQYLSLAQSLMKFPAGRDKFLHDCKCYLAPELINHQQWDRTIDIFGAGLVLFEMLTGEPLYQKGSDISITEEIEKAQMATVSGDRAPLPEEIKKVLLQSLDLEPSKRYSSVTDMRKALDLLLFSSEFSPTTFNLAFFMHSLFRENIDEEARSLNSLKKIDISSLIKEEPAPQPLPSVSPKVEHPVGATTAKDMPVTPAAIEKEAQPRVMAKPEVFVATAQKERSRVPLFAILGLIVIAVVGTMGLFFKPSFTQVSQKSVTAPAITAEQMKIQQAQEVERQRLEQEALQARADAAKKDEQLKQLIAEMEKLKKSQQEQLKKAAVGETPPVMADATTALKKLEEQAKKLQEEKKQQEVLAQQKLKAAQDTAAAEATTTPAQPVADASASPAKAEQQPSPTPAAGNSGQPSGPPVSENVNPPAVETATPQATEGQAPPPDMVPEAPALKEGDLVGITPDLIKPQLIKTIKPNYPPAAAARKVEGKVILSILVAETGNVADVKVLRQAGGKSGLNEAAVAAARKWQFRPAVKDGKRVKVWITIPIEFKAPTQ